MTIAKPEGPAVLELTDVSKAFGPVQALSNVSLKLVPGQVHCLAGENGAGKSTLIRVLTGALHRDSGSYDDRGCNRSPPSTPAALRAAGVQAVYQELSLLPHLSVGENMFMGRLPSRSGMVRGGELRSRCRTVLDRLGLDDVSPDTIVERLPAATKQLVEIAKVLTADSVKVIVFDEPTTALTEAESDRLLDQIRRFREEGVAMLYVTHRLEEMFAIGDWVTVLRDGGLSQSGPMSDYTKTNSSPRWSAGRCPRCIPTRSGNSAPARLSVRGLRRTAESPAVDFDARAGEILGIGGLLGSGRSELLLSIFGSEPIVEGEIKIDGETVEPDWPAQHDELRGRAAHRGPQGSRAAAGAVDPGERHHRQPAVGIAEGAAARERTGRRPPTSFWTACDCAPGPTTSRCPPCPAAISRRCCWPAGC